MNLPGEGSKSAQIVPCYFRQIPGLHSPKKGFFIPAIAHVSALNGMLTGASMNQTLRTAGIFAIAALLVTGISFKPVLAAGTDNPPAPTSDGGKKKMDSKKKKKDESKAIEDQDQKLAQEKFLADYRAARQLILAGNYKEGIAAMHALGHDEHPDVANYIGYSYRKMGNYDDSQVWYEKALAADPNHVRTWSYYGMWQMEQGNRLKATEDLQKVKLLCGSTSCEEYRQLKAVIDGTESY
jgi:tetratricopeptide repeat protein